LIVCRLVAAGRGGNVRGTRAGRDVAMGTLGGRLEKLEGAVADRLLVEEVVEVDKGTWTAGVGKVRFRVTFDVVGIPLVSLPALLPAESPNLPFPFPSIPTMPVLLPGLDNPDVEPEATLD
jgi:hypothetical protein